MTEPGYVPPPQPGWWVRKDRVGTAQTVTDYETSVDGYKPTHYWKRKQQVPNGGVGPMALRNKFRRRPTRNPAKIDQLLTPRFYSAGAGGRGLATSWSWSHTIDTGTTAVVLYMNVSAGGFGGATAPTYTATFGGVAMSNLGSVYGFYDGTTYTWLLAFGLLNPPVGVQTVSVSGPSSYSVMNTLGYINASGWGQLTVTDYMYNGAAVTNPSWTSPSATSTKTMVGAIAGYTQTLTNFVPNQRSYQNWVSGQGLSTIMGDGEGVAGATLGCTLASASAVGLSVDVMATIPTYSTPTWVGNGLGSTGLTGRQTPGYTWTEVVPADANCAVMWVSELPNAIPKTCTVTIGGTSMIEMVGSPWTYDFSSNWNRMRGFYLLNPPTGPQSVAITMTTNNYVHAETVYYGGVTSVAPVQPAWGPGSTAPSITIANSSSSHLYAAGTSYRAVDSSSTFTAFSPSGRWRAVRSNATTSTNPLAAGDDYGNGGSLTISATRNGTTYPWQVAAVDLSPAALPTYSTPTWVGTGVGYPHFTGNASWTETVPANANCAILILGVLGSTAITVTLNGTSMTAITPVGVNAGAYTLQAFRLLSPSTGASKTLSITNTNGNYVQASMIYYGGVTSVSTATSLANQTTSAPSISTSSTTNHMYVNAFAHQASAVERWLTYDQTLRWPGRYESSDLPIITGDAAGTGSTLAFNATHNGTTNQWGGIILDLA